MNLASLVCGVVCIIGGLLSSAEAHARRRSIGWQAVGLFFMVYSLAFLWTVFYQVAIAETMDTWRPLVFRAVNGGASCALAAWLRWHPPCHAA